MNSQKRTKGRLEQGEKAKKKIQFQLKADFQPDLMGKLQGTNHHRVPPHSKKTGLLCSIALQILAGDCPWRMMHKFPGNLDPVFWGISLEKDIYELLTANTHGSRGMGVSVNKNNLGTALQHTL